MAALLVPWFPTGNGGKDEPGSLAPAPKRGPSVASGTTGSLCATTPPIPTGASI